MANNTSKKLVQQVNPEVLEQLLLISESFVKGDFSRRIITNVNDGVINKIITNLNEYSDQQLISSATLNNDGKYNLSHFIETITAFVNHEFDYKLELSDGHTIIDAIAAGINFLGEELQHTSISRNYFSNIFNSVSDVLIVFNSKGIITDVNLASEEVFQTAKENIINTDLKKIIDFEVFFKPEKTLKSFETILYNISGVGSPYLCTISNFIDNNKGSQNYLLIAKDISEQKERDLKEKKLVINAIEKERLRLSNDIHDSFGQEISAVKMYLNSISNMDSSTDSYKVALETCKLILNNSVGTVRDICFDLMPKVLEEGGFIHACMALIIKLSKVYEIEYNFPNFDISLCKENQAILYRIIQEFLNNSIKHSECTKIKFKIVKTKNNIQIHVTDNGKGFNMSKVIKGNGLHNIISRIEVLQIRHDFKSEIKKGTSLKLYIDK